MSSVYHANLILYLFSEAIVLVLRVACCVLRVACVLRAMICVLRVVCCVLRVRACVSAQACVRCARQNLEGPASPL